MRSLLLITLLIAGSFTAMPQTNDAPKKSPAELMREMRLKQLTMPPRGSARIRHQSFPRSALF